MFWEGFRMDEFKRGNNPLGPLPSRSRTVRVGSRSSRSRRRGSGGRGGGFKRLFNWKWLVLVLLTAVLLVVGGCSALFMQARTVDLSKLNEIEYASTIYDINNKPVMKIGVKREYVKIEDIEKVNPDLPEAFVKVEDARFYDHSGVDYYGLARAIVTNIKSGGKAQGASTITMQVAGNVILEDREKKYSRKIKEIATALNLERRYDKPKILEAYLNFILFGQQIYGIQMASKYYFNKDVTKDKLEPHEIAYLAGLPKAPNKYNCFSEDPEKREAARKRRDVVLNEMAEDYIRKPIITKGELQESLKKNLGCKEEGRKQFADTTDKLAAYKEFVIDEITSRYNITADDLGRRGYRIYTGLDVKAQQKTDEILKDDATYRNVEHLDGGSITLDPKTGLIAAIGGGRKYIGSGFPIRSTEEKVQPGSAIKPLTVYAPAIEVSGGKINEHYILDDSPINIGGWRPKNAVGGPKGQVPMVETVKNSYNLSTINLLREHVKLGLAWEYGRKLGLNLKEKDRGYSPLALGGLTNGVTALEMAQAYSVFANNGTYIEAHAVREIKQDLDEDGEFEVKEPEREPKKVEVFDKKTAYYMTRMLVQVIESGTGVEAKLEGGRVAAGKTGTTNEGKEAYFVGFTPQLVNASFIYNLPGDDPLTLSGGRHAAPIFKKIMDEAHKGKPKLSFKNPGVPEPPIPIQAKGLSLTGKYNASIQAVQLNWTNLGENVSYDVYRDGKKIATTPATSFSDTNIEIPNVFGSIFGGKSYTYKVVAKDPSNNSTKESNSVTVRITSGQDDDQDETDCNESPNGPSCQRQCRDNPSLPWCGDRDNECPPWEPNCQPSNNNAQGGQMGGQQGGRFGGGNNQRGNGGRLGGQNQGGNDIDPGEDGGNGFPF